MHFRSISKIEALIFPSFDKIYETKPSSVQISKKNLKGRCSIVKKTQINIGEAVKHYQYVQSTFWNLEVFHKIFDKSYSKVGKIKKSEFPKLYVRQTGDRKQLFHNLNIVSAYWHLLKLCNSMKPNVWYLWNLEKAAIKMWFRFNFAKNLKDRHFVLGGLKNLKLSQDTCFGVCL